MSPADLRNDVVYITPLGRRCWLQPRMEGKFYGDCYLFRYVPHKRSSVLGNGDGFSLTAANLRILRQEFRS